jgi:hypothetical protein
VLLRDAIVGKLIAPDVTDASIIQADPGIEVNDVFFSDPADADVHRGPY